MRLTYRGTIRREVWACNTRASISMRIKWYTLTERSRYFVPASGHYVSAYSAHTRARENKALIGNP